MPSLDRAATELGGEGFPGSVGRRGGPFGIPPFEPIGPGGPPEVGGVARLPRPDEVGENGGSDLGLPAWYWLMPDHSLPSAETGDMVPLRPFMARWGVNVCAPGVVLEPSLSYPFIHRKFRRGVTKNLFTFVFVDIKTDCEDSKGTIGHETSADRGLKRPGVIFFSWFVPAFNVERKDVDEEVLFQCRHRKR